MLAGMAKRIQFFRPGTQRPLEGGELNFSDRDLEATASSYDPSLSEAPLVIGHPKLDAPAYGWVESVAFEGGHLEATPRQVNPEFAEMVENGSFKKVSGKFWHPDNPNNPVPGVYYLKHIGFLGATPPAVKGLRPVEFAEDDGPTITVELDARDLSFGEVRGNVVKRLFQRVRDWIIDEHGKGKADEIIPQWDIEDIERGDQSFAEPQPNPPQEESEDMDKTELERREKEIQEREASFAEKESAIEKRERELAERQAATARAGHVEFAESMVKAGKLLPRLKDGLVEVLCNLDGGADIEFAEEEGKASTKVSPTDFLHDLVKSLPEQISFGERGAPNEDNLPPADIEFAAPQGYEVNRDDLATHNRALAYQQKNGGDYVAAVKAVQRGV